MERPTSSRSPTLQLDRVPPRPLPLAEAPRRPEFSGTPDPVIGVFPIDLSGGEAGSTVPMGRRVRVRTLVLVVLAAWTLLGQGERCRVDARFATPSATLATYWSALRDGDAATMGECVVRGAQDQPFPGMLWFMPPTRTVRLDEFRSLPVSAGRLFVSYRVRFRPLGALEEQCFPTAHELVRVHGCWRIARGLGQASLPEWKPIPRAVDI
jgi:hypothetical protein